MSNNRYQLTNASSGEIWTNLTATDLRWRFDVPSTVVSFLEHQVVGHKIAKGFITVEVVR
jgi:hypothetical protein